MTEPCRPPILLSSPSGLTAALQRNGSLTWLSHGDLRLNRYPGTAVEAGPTNLWLRARTSGAATAHPLLGPGSRSVVGSDGSCLVVEGHVDGLAYRAVLALALALDEPAWCWRVEVTSTAETPVDVDLVHAQDVGLARAGVVRTNELYVSQYLDETPLDHPEHGTVVAVRQNLAQDGRIPWLLLGSLRRGVGFATDALQLHGLAARAGRPAAALGLPELPSTRLQHEHALVTLQDAPARLRPGESLTTGFFGYLRTDHPEATSTDDLRWVDRALAIVPAGPVTEPTPPGAAAVVPTVFDPPALLAARDLTEAEVTARYGSDPRCVERRRDALASFFRSPRHHVVLRGKELRVLRPHGHLLRTGAHLVPDPRTLTTTTAMAGLVNSFVTQGHVSVNRFLSTARGYLGLQRAFGQRLFVEQGGQWRLLDVPSAYEMELDRARWVYRHAAGEIEVTTLAPAQEHAITLAVRVTQGPPARFLAVHHVGCHGDDGLEPHRLDVAVDGDEVVVSPHPGSAVAARNPGGTFVLHLLGGASGAVVGDDAALFADGASRDLPYLTVRTAPTTAWRMRITGRLVPPGPDGPPHAEGFWDEVAGGVTLSAAGAPAGAAVERLSHLLPWLAHNALVHYLSPRGLEQYTGGAWGTRDVSQGPVELLLAIDRHQPLRALLPLVYRAQSPAGDWPQAFGCYDDDQDFRLGPPHGDVVLWPLVALGQYLLASGDATVLDERVPFHAAAGPPETATLLEHALRAVRVAGTRVIPGTHLSAYGHGDWNDSLQPADTSMPDHLCSSWTVTLHVQALRTLADGLARAGRTEHVTALREQADGVLADFHRHLVPDGVIAGYAFFAEDGTVRHLIHPSDRETGLTYSLLPMIHGVINELLTPKQAADHVRIIREHLLAPDGARLFDSPPAYRGGPMVHFQRAETATFFGREIGLMYTHAHLRYAEAMARLGDGEALLQALEQANPIGLAEVVRTARPRQANCYSSSSDACFADRYQAGAQYDRVRAGSIDVEAGWRVYSSGAGITYRLVVECLLGLARRAASLVVDPVLPRSLDGLRATLRLAGRPVGVTYRVGPRGSGPESVVLNGHELAATRLMNRYRTGGLEVDLTEVLAALGPDDNELAVILP